MIVLRLGKFEAVAEPGLRLLIPVLDTPMFVEMRVQTVPIAQQQAITKDNVPVVVNGVIFFKVVDAESAALKVQDYRAAIWRLAQATLRDVAGQLSLDELLSHQVRLETEIAQNVEAQARAWGLKVDGIKLEDISVPEELKKMMSRQASSEREKRATIIKADGDRQAAAALSEAAATMAASPGAMQLRTLQTIDGLGPSASNTVVLSCRSRSSTRCAHTSGSPERRPPAEPNRASAESTRASGPRFHIPRGPTRATSIRSSGEPGRSRRGRS